MMPPAPKPFLKWVGGKTQLLTKFQPLLPKALLHGDLARYVEPFLGGGALYFHLSQKYPLTRAHLSDCNAELVSLFNLVKTEPRELLAGLTRLRDKFWSLKEPAKKTFYYECRDRYNALALSKEPLEKGALMIFLNKTCYNGLFRVNSSGLFNAPFGALHHKPAIFSESNILAASQVLQKSRITRADFRKTVAEVKKNGSPEKTFVYLDPPYRPLTKTAGFTGYANGGFCETDQQDLARVFRDLDGLGAQVMLSNSDPKNEKPDDTFFEKLFAGYRITRVPARRAINSNAKKRGAVMELVITNY